MLNDYLKSPRDVRLELAERAKAERLRQNLTQEALAHAAGIDRDVREFRFPGPQFEQQPRHRQNAGVAGADHADLLPGCGGFERGPAPRHLAHHAVLDDWFSDDAIDRRHSTS